MNIFLNIVILVIGAIILIKAADCFVDSATVVARKLKISPLIIGLTIISIGTSLPELAISLVSAIKANTTADLAMGNIIGSNITNLTLILGIGAFISPIIVQKKVFRRDGIFLLLATGLLLIFGLFFQANKQIVFWEGIILLLVAIIYFFTLIKTTKKEDTKELVQTDNVNQKEYNKFTLLVMLLGIVGIAVGAEMVTRPAQYLAEKAAISFGLDKSLATTLVGLTVVAIGTSLPELATSIAAAKRNQSDLVLGNIIGSNILNILFIVGVTATVTPLGINKAIATDLIILFLITTLVSIFLMRSKIFKSQGAFLILIYISYIIFAVYRTLNG
ncbi:Sodium/calcium antiporter [Alteracholeplasma palmae J233]|uniref:Sodium/calcium antiporter n=1 Tax=Alteracholeplasma palmae (strain ATCC 49389 / J233) TaxID=1318466 RepID=U4KS09_ALTPJ|nr:calcium/sodium antiporter [Alteracholeplasma palmae]CCV64616.1 Sodium/calcium antiporter [Alteracholeplasma palmae J233]